MSGSPSVAGAPPEARAPPEAVGAVGWSVIPCPPGARRGRRRRRIHGEHGRARRANLRRPPLAKCLEAEDGGRDAHVQGLRPPHHRDAHPGVEGGGQAVSDTGGLVAQHHRHPAGPIEPGVDLAVAHHRAHGGEPEAVEGTRHLGCVPTHHDRRVEDRTGRSTDRLGVGGVDRPVAAHHGVHPRGVRGPDDGAGVARIAHVGTDEHQRGPGDLVERGRGESHHGQDRLGGHGVGHPLDDPGRQVEDPGTGVEGPPDGVGHRRRPRPRGAT